MDADVFEEVAQQPNTGVFTIRFGDGKFVFSYVLFLSS